MAQAIGDLTDKEKEALRLLVEGHDAKSSANFLGLSVHTVNDRLRNARRKLDVSVRNPQTHPKFLRTHLSG